MGFNTNFGATDVPTPYRVPKAGSTGKLAAGWLVLPINTVNANPSGTALVGGDATGNDRGDMAIDIQMERTDVAQVASGARAVAIGTQLTASGGRSLALGYKNTASGQDSISMGYGAKATADTTISIGTYAYALEQGASAIGRFASAYAKRSMAFGGAYIPATGIGSLAVGLCQSGGTYAVSVGIGVKAFKPFSTKISGFPTISGIATTTVQETPAERHARYTAPLTAAATQNIDAKVATVASRRSIVMPSNCRMFVDRVQVVAVDANTVTGQPSISVGGFNRGTAGTLINGFSGASSAQTIDINSSAGLSVGDYLLFGFLNGEANDAGHYRPAAVAKVTAIPNGTSVTVDFICTSAGGNSGDPWWKLTGTATNIQAGTATSGLTSVGVRHQYSLTPTTGYEILVFEVTAAATGTTLPVRCIANGAILEMNGDGATS